MSVIYDRQKDMNLNVEQNIAVVGCGGIGFHVVKMLVMSGIKNIHAYDNDTIEPHNLNRLDVSLQYVGRKKTDVLEEICMSLRPDCNFNGYPFDFKEYMFPDNVNWLIDCTDKLESQKYNYGIATKKNIKYMKAGYDGYSVSINNKVASWGDVEDGYRITPSFVAPAMIIASLTVVKVLNPLFHSKEMSGYVNNLYRN